MSFNQPGDTIYLIYAATGQWSSGPMVLTKDAFSEEEWENYLVGWREQGQTIVTAVITEKEDNGRPI